MISITDADSAAFRERMKELEQAEPEDSGTILKIKKILFAKSAVETLNIANGRIPQEFKKRGSQYQGAKSILKYIAIGILGDVKLPFVTEWLKDRLIRNLKIGREISTYELASALMHHIGGDAIADIIRPYKKIGSKEMRNFVEFEVLDGLFPNGTVPKFKRKKPDVGDLQPPKKFRASPAHKPAGKVKLPNKV
jgi:hypothetical protein